MNKKIVGLFLLGAAAVGEIAFTAPPEDLP
jgi:hypothetical protein